MLVDHRHSAHRAFRLSHPDDKLTVPRRVPNASAAPDKAWFHSHFDHCPPRSGAVTGNIAEQERVGLVNDRFRTEALLCRFLACLPASAVLNLAAEGAAAGCSPDLHQYPHGARTSQLAPPCSPCLAKTVSRGRRGTYTYRHERATYDRRQNDGLSGPYSPYGELGVSRVGITAGGATVGLFHCSRTMEAVREYHVRF